MQPGLEEAMQLMAVACNPVQAAQVQVMFLYGGTRDYKPETLGEVIAHSQQISRALANLTPPMAVLQPVMCECDEDDDETEVEFG